MIFNFLSKKIGSDLHPVFPSWKIIDDCCLIKVVEGKTPLINQHCIVLNKLLSCDLCDSDYVRFTPWHLFQHIAKRKYSVMGKYLKEDLNLRENT